MPTDFSKIVFDNAQHTYTYENQPLTPVTSILKLLIPPFERDRISRQIAKREGLSQKQIIRKWEKSSKEALNKGTRLHTYIEQILSGNPNELMISLNKIIPEMTAFNTFWTNLMSKQSAKSPQDIIVAQEMVIGDIEYGIAGKFDLMLKLNKKNLVDWKSGKFDVRNKFSNLLPPFNDIEDCHLNRYSIQLSLYRLIYERNTNETLGDNYLIHLDENGGHHLLEAKDFRKRLEIWLSNRQHYNNNESEAKEIIDKINNWDNRFISGLSTNTINDISVAMNKVDSLLSNNIDISNNESNI